MSQPFIETEETLIIETPECADEAPTFQETFSNPVSDAACSEKDGFSSRHDNFNRNEIEVIETFYGGAGI